LVLPAALSRAEIATAISESGGIYHFIDRAMGPLFGTGVRVGAIRLVLWTPDGDATVTPDRE
jgi:amino acid transporter